MRDPSLSGNGQVPSGLGGVWGHSIFGTDVCVVYRGSQTPCRLLLQTSGMLMSPGRGHLRQSDEVLSSG